jgi:hypothetical protein
MGIIWTAKDEIQLSGKPGHGFPANENPFCDLNGRSHIRQSRNAQSASGWLRFFDHQEQMQAL